MEAGPSSSSLAAFPDNSRKNGVQRVQRARRGAAVASTHNEIDQIILEEMKREGRFPT